VEIIRAEHSGLCFGVRNALDIAFDSVDGKSEENTIYTCGPIIHNRHVIEKLADKGVVMIDTLAEASKGDSVIVRSHGEPKAFYDEAEARGIKLIDTTCVFVARIHEFVLDAYNKGMPIIIIGSSDHQEVIATNGWCENSAVVIGSAGEAERFAQDHQGSEDTFFIVCQTTFRPEVMEQILTVLDENRIKYEIKNTICNATRDRQVSCAELSQKVDAMIVIGDKKSSNSRKLYEIAADHCSNAYFIQDISDLELKEISNYYRIGITAGASTPEWIIKEVISSMSENVMNEAERNPMMDFMDDIENSLRLPRPGEIVDGKVHAVTENEVIVNMGCKKDGILPKYEVTLEEGQTLFDLFKEGDEIQAKVLKSDDGEGGILLSKKKLEMNENYKELAEAMENKETITVKLTRAVNGGVIAAYKEVTGFVPMSQLSDKFVESADEFIGQTVDVKVIRVDNKRGRAVFSRKAVLVDDKRKQVAEIWNNLQVGDIVEGKVMRFTDYGAFVDIGGVDGLLHISEISWGKLKHPQEVLKIGEIINVKILSLNEEKGKISLGLKQTQPEPWTLVGTKYQEGQIIQGKVVQIKEYGAFVELEAGLDGLVHISEIANKRVEDVNQELTVGQEIQAKIMEIDAERKRISLSIRAALPEEDASEEAAPVEAETVQEAPVEEATPEAAETEEA
jgi:(E)-4-hydroxy-3-methyl-but-2-enyl pyrophosphate reductase